MRIVIALLIAIGLVGCATSVDPTPGPGPGPDPGPGPGPDPGPGPGPDPVLYPDPDWATGTPEDHAIDSAKLEEAAAAAELNGSFCLLVIRHGVLVFERYFGDATPTDAHNSWSIAKSYSSTLVGIAIERGEIRSLDDSVADYLPEWRGTEHEAVTIRHLITMTSGLEWSVFSDYVRMATFASNHSEYATDLDQSAPPGSEWTYHNGAVQVLEPVFRAATGMTIEEYAAIHLWPRLGMHATWAHDRSGNPTTYANVLATCRDHARFGYLYLRNGRWAGGEQIVSESWIREATTPSQEFNRGYGYLLWLNGEAPTMSAMNDVSDERIMPFAPTDMFAARGFGNQFIDVIPSMDLVIVRFGNDPRTAMDVDAIREDAQFEEHDMILEPILQGVR